MAKNSYRTANGKSVDMRALQLKNETVKAVGNMNVNARGDVVNNANNVIDSKAHQKKRMYDRQTNVQDAPVAESIAKAKQEAVAKVEEVPVQATQTKTDDGFSLT
jgi:hypothetical protein